MFSGIRLKNISALFSIMGMVGNPHFQTVKNIKNGFWGNITGCEMTEPDCTYHKKSLRRRELR